MSSYFTSCLALSSALLLGPSFAADHLVFKGGDGPGKGKHVVLVAGDEEYRSEESLPMLARILAGQHGFTATVLFSTGADGTIDPNNQASLTHPEALDHADAIIIQLRFRGWNEDGLNRFEAALQRGVPLIGLRTSTHAFNLPEESAHAKWSWNRQGGFGKMVFGETWVSHWGDHGKEATRGVIEPSAKGNPILRGVTEVFGTTDVYEAAPPADAVILLRGEVLKGLNPGDPPAERRKRTAAGGEQDVNDPMMPIAWTRELKTGDFKGNKVLCTTMGAATDFQSEGLRRLVVNGVYWGLGMEVPAKAKVEVPADWNPTPFGFDGFRKGVKVQDMAPGYVR